MKSLLPAILTILFAMGCAILGLRTLMVEPSPQASTNSPTAPSPQVSSNHAVAERPVERRVALPQQKSHDFEPLEVPELAKRRVLYASGLPNGKYRALAIDDG